MELYIFNRELEFQGILDNFFSFRWIRKYHKIGEFELQCALTSASLELLKKENIIYKKDDIEAAYIEYRNLKQDVEGKEILIVKGKFLTGYLNRRIVWGTEILNTATEVAMRTLVEHNCINPIEHNRVINNLILGTLKNFTGNINKQVSYDNLTDTLEDISNISGLGYRVNFDIHNRKLMFDVYKGIDRSVNQSINPMSIFSKEFENILEQEYIDSLNNYRNVNLVAGVGEEVDRKLAIVGSASGLDRFELFTDARDIRKTKTVDNTEVAISDEEYTQMLQNRGNEKLAERTDIQTFDSKININSNLIYKVDFDLGDIVTCLSKKWGIAIDTRMTEVEEVYEEQGHSINVTFGNNVPTLLDKIKQNLR